MLLFLLLPKPTFASWVIDFEPPTFTPPSVLSCYDNSNGKPESWVDKDISITPTDTLSAIWYCDFYLKDDGGSTVTSYENIIPTPISTPPPSYRAKCDQTIPTSVMNSNQKYQISYLAVDNSGNGKTGATGVFTYKKNCKEPPVTPPPSSFIPWLQVTEGDVHSNKDINTPGGPGP